MEDVKKVESVVSDMRKFLRQHPRIIQRLHRRVFLDGVNRDQVGGAISRAAGATGAVQCRALVAAARHPVTCRRVLAHIQQASLASLLAVLV